MKGSYKVDIQNKRIRYQFTIKRNITIIRGDSATGKTKLLEMIEEFSQDQKSSGISLKCDVPCIVLHGGDWRQRLAYTHNSLVFADECNEFIRRKEFADAVNYSDNYYVLVSRDDYPNLAYSVEEIYGIRLSKQYAGLKQIYNEFYHLYGNQESVFAEHAASAPVSVLVEDSNSGFELYKAFIREGIQCDTARGKSNLYKILLQGNADDKTVVIADGAAFGAEMERIMQLIEAGLHVALYLPESFEWVVLQSDILADKEVRNILQHPEDHIESEKYLSWEQYFTKLLVTKTSGSFMRYQKEHISDYYLQKKNGKKIIAALPKQMRQLFSD